MAIELDPENTNLIYLIDDFQNVISLRENMDEKVSIDSTVSLTPHNMEDELKEFQKRPWNSVCICDRTINLNNYCFSINTKFFWNGNKNTKSTLLREEPFINTHYML